MLIVCFWCFVHRKSSELGLDDFPLSNTNAVIISIAEYVSVRIILDDTHCLAPQY